MSRQEKTMEPLDFRNECQNLVSAPTCGCGAEKVEIQCSRESVSSSNQSNASDKIVFKGDKLIALSTDHL